MAYGGVELSQFEIVIWPCIVISFVPQLVQQWYYGNIYSHMFG